MWSQRPGDFVKRYVHMAIGAMLLAPVASSSWAQPGAPLDIAANERIIAACRNRPELHGSWVWLNPKSVDGMEHYEAIFLVDAARSAAQVAALQPLISDVPLVGKPKVVALPISQFLKELKVRLVQERGMRGNYIHGAYFAPVNQEGRIQLNLFGRISSAEEMRIIESEVNELVKKHPSLQEPTMGLSILVNEKGLAANPPSPDWERDLKLVQAHLETDDALHGCWVRLTECYDQQDRFVSYDVNLYYDPAKGPTQLSNLQRAIKSILKRPFEVVATTEVPLTKLLDGINLNLEASRDFDGCVVEKAYYRLQRGKLEDPEMVLQGQVDKPHHPQRIKEQICDPLMRLDARWENDFPNCPTVTEDLEVLAYQQGQGALFFSDGMYQFRQRNYGDAAKSFRLAYINAPHAVEYRYWHVAAHQAAGNDSLAFKHMVSTLKRGQSNSDRLRVLRSLESLQGSPRVELTDLEAAARRELFRYQKLRVPKDQFATRSP